MTDLSTAEQRQLRGCSVFIPDHWADLIISGWSIAPEGVTVTRDAPLAQVTIRDDLSVWVCP